MEFFNSLNLTQIKGGTKLKQGDLGSVLSYSLTDENGQEITSFDTKTAYINLVLDDKIWFTTTTLVDISRVTFRIDKAIPTGLYYLEIKIDDYIFPSDRDSIILIEEGSTPYDLKELVPNYDINMTIKGILSDLSQKGIDISDLKTKMKAIYNNALADHAEVAKARGEFKTLSERLNDLLSRMRSIASGSPKGAYLNLEALKSALPNGGDGIYVTADNGHWYYYNNGWQDGGIYQAMNTELDFDSFSEEMLELFNFDVRLVDIEIVQNSYFSHPTGQIVANNDTSRTNMIPVTRGEIYIVSSTSYFDARVATFVDGEGRVLKSYPATSEHSKFNTIIEVPDDAVGLYLNTEKGKEMFLLKLVNIYGRLGELAYKISETAKNWEKVELTVNKAGTYYSIHKILPETPDSLTTTYKAIPVQTGETYKVEGSNYWNGRLWITLDKLGRVSRYFDKDDQNAHTDKITIKDGESLLFINSHSSNPAKLYKAVVGMPKKTITAIGDSWTDANTLSGNNWVDYCIELFSSKYNIDLDVKNLGIGGTGFLNSNETHGNYSERDIPADSDLYIVFGSFNDAFVEFEFGDVETHQKGTMYGAMHDAVSKIYSKNIDAKILFVTPGPWGAINPQRPLKAGPRENAAAFAEEYVSAMINFGKYNSIPVLDFYHNSNLRPWDGNFINRFYHGTSETDDTHPNSDGHKRITPQIADFIFKEL